jgi:hypothetical protein
VLDGVGKDVGFAFAVLTFGYKNTESISHLPVHSDCGSVLYSVFE